MRFQILVALVASLPLCCAASEQEPPHSPLPDNLSIPWQTRAGRDASVGSDAGALPDAPSIELRPLESCGDSSAGFEGWIEAFRRHAVGQQIQPSIVIAALATVRYDDEVVALDRSQAAHKLSFEEFYKRHVSRDRLVRGKEQRRERADLLAKLDERYGVAPEVLVAIWGLETDYGRNVGTRSSLNALATLAYDCRRAERFRGELMSALRILQRGDLAAHDMVGAWAGELGQTQFLPSSYERFAIDFDGDGRANLVGSASDALASTANYLQQHGWRPKEGYGPGTHNFGVLSEWNASGVYRQTIAKFAAQIGKGKSQ